MWPCCNFSGLEVPEFFQSVDSDRKFIFRRPHPFLYIYPFYIDGTTVYHFVVNHGAFHVHGMNLIPNPCFHNVIPAVQSPGNKHLVKLCAVCIPSALEIKLH